MRTKIPTNYQRQLADKIFAALDIDIEVDCECGKTMDVPISPEKAELLNLLYMEGVTSFDELERIKSKMAMPSIIRLEELLNAANDEL